VTVFTVLLIVLSSIYLPAFFRERGDFYTSFEYAQMYLRDDRYTELIIEYNYVLGYPPSPGSKESLITTIEELSDKDSVVDVVGDGITPRLGINEYHRHDIEDIFDSYSHYERKGSTMVLNVLYLDGEWAENPNVLGLSYGGEYMVLFKETIHKVSLTSSNLGVEDVETSVLIHEFGHILGLVGIGYESNHEDDEYEHHCDESAGRCVMSASVEIKMGGYSEEPPTEFCELCLEDIERIRFMEDDWGVEEHLTILVVGGQAAIGAVWVAVCISPKGKEEYDLYQDYYDDIDKKTY